MSAKPLEHDAVAFLVSAPKLQRPLPCAPFPKPATSAVPLSESAMLAASRPRSPPKPQANQRETIRAMEKLVQSVVPRPASPQRPASRPASPPAKLTSLPGFIAAPGDAYSTPPTVVLRSVNGVAEGQLQYQLGKMSPLTPSYAPSWVCDPPQRSSVTDLRLQPSQRKLTCYSPQFLSISASFPAPSTCMLAQAGHSPRRPHAPALTGMAPPPRDRAANVSPPPMASAAAQLPAAESRGWALTGLGGMEAEGGPVAEPDALRQAAGCQDVLPQPPPQQQQQQQPLELEEERQQPEDWQAQPPQHAHSQPGHALLSGTVAEQEGGGVSSVRVNGSSHTTSHMKALTLSRFHSRIVREDDSPLSTPARNTHYPMPSDAQALAATVMSHEHGAGLRHKRVLALLGPLP
ncbi:hypothetical protein QJQ45_013837 [Haematococcus lacustris]|nr:hypothetical protein QJQ45_013837 [Haematococcus lacustris]